MYKIAVLGDKDSVLGFKAWGWRPSPWRLRSRPRRPPPHGEGGLRVIYLTETFAADMSAEIEHYKDELKPYFTFVSVDADLHERLSNKTSFYELCAQYDLPHPLTFVLDKAGAAAGKYHDLPFGFPVAVKPANSVEYLHVDFPGRKKRSFCTRPRSWPMSLRDLRCRLRLRADHPGLHPGTTVICGCSPTTPTATAR